MKHPKIIFFDIDGTLIDMERKKVSERTMFALKRLKEKGILICLATGRSPLTLPKWENIEFDAYLTFNGSFCFKKEETIYSHSLAKEDLQQILHNAELLGRPVSIATKDALAANGYDEDLAEYYSFAKLELEVSPDYEQLLQEEVYQIMMGCREEDYPAVLSGVSHAKIAAWWDRAIDIIPSNSGKGIGIQKILAYYGIEKEDAIAFGDGNNDIEMFQAVGLGVAMENASSDLKKVADDVCGHVKQDGVYAYCVEKGWISSAK